MVILQHLFLSRILGKIAYTILKDIFLYFVHDIWINFCQ